MSEHLITIEGGATKRLPVGGKFCDRDILITALSDAGGGSLPEGISNLTTGTIIPASNITTDYTVTHGLGKKPDFAVLMLVEDAATTALKSTQVFQMLGHKPFISNGTVNYTRGFIIYQNNSSQAANTIVNFTDSSFADDTTMKFRAFSTYPLSAGYTYQWLCGAWD